VHNDRNDREQQQQMDKHSRALEHDEPAQPQHNQDHSKDQKHEDALLSSFKVSRDLREQYK
jgi:hypothetical protein